MANPYKWHIPAYEGTSELNTVMEVTYLVTTCHNFDISSLTLVDNNGNTIDLTLPDGSTKSDYSKTGITGNGSTYVGRYKLSTSTAYPLSLSTNVSNNSGAQKTSIQPFTPLGVKSSGVVACHQGNLFCNDKGSDKDYNDLVLTFQLYTQSTD